METELRRLHVLPPNKVLSCCSPPWNSHVLHDSGCALSMREQFTFLRVFLVFVWVLASVCVRCVVAAAPRRLGAPCFDGHPPEQSISSAPRMPSAPRRQPFDPYPGHHSEEIMPSRCSHGGCTTGPSYGLAGTKKAKYCSKHAKEGMVNVRDKRCAHTENVNVGLGL